MLDPSDNILMRWWNASYLRGGIHTLNKILYKRHSLTGVGGGGSGGGPSDSGELWFSGTVIKIPSPAAPHTQWALLWAKEPQEQCFFLRSNTDHTAPADKLSYNRRSFPHLGLVEDFGTFTPQRTTLPTILLKRSHYDGNIKLHATELVTWNILCLLYS